MQNDHLENLKQRSCASFHLGDMIAENLGLAFLYILASLVLILTIFSVVKALIKLHSTLKWQRKLPLIPISLFMATTNFSVKSPLLIGIFRPCIVIPKHLLATYDHQELEAVCSHEKKSHPMARQWNQYPH